MPRKKAGEVPSLRRHKTGQGVVTIAGKDYYLGVWPLSQKTAPATVKGAYDRLIAEWLEAGRPQEKHFVRTGPCAAGGDGPSVAELILAFWQFAR